MSRRPLFVRITAALLCVSGAARAAVVLATNRDELLDRRIFVPPHPVEPRAHAEGTGFIAVGHFNGMSDGDIQTSVLTVNGITALAAAFRQFGPHSTEGVDRQHGLFDFSSEAPVAPGGVFDGQPVYLVVGDAPALARSPSLLIYKTGQTFQPDDAATGPGTGVSQAPVSILLTPAAGTLLAGTFAGAQYQLSGSSKPTERDYLDSFKAECPGANLDDVLADPDGDGLSNREEYQLCTNPCQADTDQDGRSDKQENDSQALPVARRTDVLHPDTDGDGVSDGIEELLGSFPNSASVTVPLRQNLRHIWPLDGHTIDLLACTRLQPSLANPALSYENSTWHRCAMITGPDPVTPQSLSVVPVVNSAAGGFGFHFRARIEEFTAPGQIVASHGPWSLRRSGSTDRLRFLFGTDFIDSATAVEVAPSGPLTSPEAQPMHRIALSVFFGQYMEMWIDGQRQGKIALTGVNRFLGPAALAAPLIVSSPVAASATRLRFDDAAWWDRPLTAADISKLDTETGPAWDLPAPRNPFQVEWVLRDNGKVTLVWPMIRESARYGVLRSTDLLSWTAATVPSIDVPFFEEIADAGRLFYQVVEAQ